MTTLEDKILNGKTAGYCSSSDDEEETSNTNNEPPISRKTSGAMPGYSLNTGPKGVMEDWRRFKQLETEKRNEQAQELLQLSKKLTLSCRTALDDEKAKEQEAEDDLLKEIYSDENFLKEYMKKRMQEMEISLKLRPDLKFGVLYELMDVDAYLQAIDQDSKKCTVIIHLYEKSAAGCDAVNGCFANLAPKFPAFKFCRISASLLKPSKQFLNLALPAVQAYRHGQLIGNFVRLTDELGDDFFADDLESFLKQYGILPDSDDVIQILNN